MDIFGGTDHYISFACSFTISFRIFVWDTHACHVDFCFPSHIFAERSLPSHTQISLSLSLSLSHSLYFSHGRDPACVAFLIQGTTMVTIRHYSVQQIHFHHH